MVVPLLLCGIGVLFATCAACFYRMGAADWADEKKFLIDSLESLASKNAKLRELVRQMHTCLTRPKVYADTSRPYLIATECPYFTQGVCDYNSCGFERRMRELGVEQ